MSTRRHVDTETQGTKVDPNTAPQIYDPGTGLRTAILKDAYDVVITDEMITGDGGQEVIDFKLPFGSEHRGDVASEWIVQANGSQFTIRTVWDGWDEGSSAPVTSVHGEALWYELGEHDPIIMTTAVKSAATAMNQIVSGTGWTVGYTGGGGSGSLRIVDPASPLTALRLVPAAFGGELEFDNINKVVHLRIHRGSDVPVAMYAHGRNLSGLSRNEDTTGLVTRLYVYGPPVILANGNEGPPLDITKVAPGGAPYIEDYSFYQNRGLPAKIRAATIISDSIDDDSRLLAWGQANLAVMSQPAYSYTVQQSNTADHDVDPVLGDVVRVHDYELGIDIGARVQMRTINVRQPWLTTYNIDAAKYSLSNALAGLGGGGGGTVTSGDTGGTNVDIPAAPTGLSLTGTAGYDSYNHLAVTAQASWTQVAQNTDGSAVTDMDHYEVQWKVDSTDWLSGASQSSAWASQIVTGGLTTALIGVYEPATILTVRVRAVDNGGNTSTWTTVGPQGLLVDTVAPPSPSAPILVDTPYASLAEVRWDGQQANGSPMPVDFLRLDVHAIRASAVNNTPANFVPSSATLVDSLASAGISVLALAPDTWYIKFVAVDTSGNASGSSANLQVTTRTIVTADIPNGTIGAAQIINASLDATKLADSLAQRINVNLYDPGNAVALWKVDSGTGVLSQQNVADSVSGGTVYRCAGGPVTIHRSDVRIPFDPNITYRVTIRVRQTVAATNNQQAVYCGVAGLAADGVTFVNTSGANSLSAQHYAATTGAPLTVGGGWQTFTGYIKGKSAPGTNGTGGPNPSPITPEKLHDSVRYITPLVYLNYNGGNGTQEIDLVTVETVEVGAVQTTNIADLAVATAKIADAAIVTAKIAALAVGTAQIADASIATVKVQDAAINNAKILDLAVNNAKIGDMSVDKLTAGRLNFDMAVGARIKTADTGARAEMNGTGFFLFDSLGNALLSAQIVGGVASVDIQGNIKAGSSMPGVVFTESLVPNGSIEDIAPGATLPTYWAQAPTTIGGFTTTVDTSAPIAGAQSLMVTANDNNSGAGWQNQYNLPVVPGERLVVKADFIIGGSGAVGGNSVYVGMAWYNSAGTMLTVADPSDGLGMSTRVSGAQILKPDGTYVAAPVTLGTSASLSNNGRSWICAGWTGWAKNTNYRAVGEVTVPSGAAFGRPIVYFYTSTTTSAAANYCRFDLVYLARGGIGAVSRGGYVTGSWLRTAESGKRIEIGTAKTSAYAYNTMYFYTDWSTNGFSEVTPTPFYSAAYAQPVAGYIAVDTTTPSGASSATGDITGSVRIQAPKLSATTDVPPYILIQSAILPGSGSVNVNSDVISIRGSHINLGTTTGTQFAWHAPGGYIDMDTLHLHGSPFYIDIQGSGNRGLVVNGAGGQSGAYLDAVNSAGSRVAAIASNGNVQGTGAYTSLSDKSVKTDIHYAKRDGALDAIKAMKPARFRYKGDSEQHQGFIAQDLATVVPEAVVPFGDDGTLGTRLDPVVATLVLAVQDLFDRVEAKA